MRHYSAAARDAVDRWAQLMGHPHVCGLRGTFVSADLWEAPALYFAHDYHAGAVTIEALHCGGGNAAAVPNCAAAGDAEAW